MIRLETIKQEAEALGDWEALALALDTELHLRHTAADLSGIALVLAEMRRVAQEGSVVAGAVANSGLALEVLFGNEDEALARARQAVESCDPQSDHRLRVLLRLLLVLQYQGAVHTEECAAVVSEARRLAKKSGDLVLRFSLENNLAVWHLDSGDLDAADVLMARSSELLGSGKLDLNRFNQAVNAGELALARGDYARARSYFLDAERYIGAKTPAFAMDIVHSGLGLCALASGDLKEARQREESLSPSPPRWYFDPSLILGFQSRMHETRGDHAKAARILEDGAAAVEGRLVLAWLKLLQGHARVLRKLSPERARDVAERGLQKSLSLKLVHRVAEFERIVKAIGAR
jgi:tetratricopeptide (TPR) repeat protein